MPRARGTDRRVQRTQALLHGALASLIHEKAYDDIVVKEILARANVGRSTFYAHFRDKDELLESGIRDVLRASDRAPSTRAAGARADRLLRFSLPILEHIDRYRRASGARFDVHKQAVVHEHLERVLVELIADDLRREGRCGEDNWQSVPCDLLARHVASTFVNVLNWWVENREPCAPSRANDLFRALLLPTLAEAFG